MEEAIEFEVLFPPKFKQVAPAEMMVVGRRSFPLGMQLRGKFSLL